MSLDILAMGELMGEFNAAKVVGSACLYSRLK